MAEIDLAALTVFRLAAGKHASAEGGLCAMEAVAWLEGLAHTDHPACTCPVLAAYVRSINDFLPDPARQRLVAYLPRLVGTVVDLPMKRARAAHLARAAVRIFAPMALRAAGLVAAARILEALPVDGDLSQARAAAGMARKLAVTAAFAARKITGAAAATAAAYAAATHAHTAIGAVDRADATDKDAYVAAAHAAGAAGEAVGAEGLCGRAGAGVWAAMFDVLDGVLAIGPAPRGLSEQAPARLAAFRQLIDA